MKEIENFTLIKIRMKELDRESAKKNLAPLTGYTGAIKEFAKLIDHDEVIMFFSSGSTNKKGIVFVSDKRIVMCSKNFVEQYPYDKISAVDYKKNFFGQGEITINSFGQKYIFSYYETKYLLEVIKYIQKRLEDVGESKLTHNNLIKNEVDIVTQLERLAKLMKDGILTEEEFKMQKGKLLAE